MFVMLSEFVRVDELLFPLKSSENLWLSQIILGGLKLTNLLKVKAKL